VFLVSMWFVWIAIFRRMDPSSRSGQVIGNIVSEWTQILGLMWMTQDRDGSWIEEAGSVQAGQKPPAVNSPKQS